jgi:hypothetical protein
MTVYPEGVWRVEVTATMPQGEDPVSPVVLIPDGVAEVSLYAVASSVATGKIEETASSAAAIAGGTATWMSVDGNFDLVGVTMQRLVMIGRYPVALRVSCLVEDGTATMILTGRKTGR